MVISYSPSPLIVTNHPPDKRLAALGLTSAFFEGSMYIFIFFKFPALKLSHKLTGAEDGMFISFCI
jgi:hypothetical protein